MSSLSQLITGVVMYPVSGTFQDYIVLVSDREWRRTSSATGRRIFVIVTCRFRKQIPVFSRERVQAVHLLLWERERERERGGVGVCWGGGGGGDAGRMCGGCAGVCL